MLDDLSHASEDEVLAVVEKRWRGLQRLRELAGDENMDFKMLGGYEMFTNEEELFFGNAGTASPNSMKNRENNRLDRGL
ncbi:MAG: hypothetical protein IPH31_24570 [Lewinellaceae bacterium]|nr:hypothetical protein [Lewinellaceae bacterium]